MKQISYNQAFTLIELLVGLALGVMVLYLAASAVSNINQSISISKELSRENNLLRQGIKAAYQDADFWHSHADPRPPFSKGFLHQEPTESQRSKRPLTKITFDKSLDPNNDTGAGNNDVIAASPGGNGTESYGKLLNPNALLAHDPRSWYRGFHKTPRGRTSLKNHGNAPDSKRAGVAYENGIGPDADDKANYTYRDTPLPEGTSEPNPPRPWHPNRRFASFQLAVPQGMDNRHFYAMDIVAATNMTRTDKYLSAAGDLSDAPDLDFPGGNPYKWSIQASGTPTSLESIDTNYQASINQYLMNHAYRVYQRLNTLGSLEYMPKGTPIMIHDETGRTPWYRSSPSLSENFDIQNTAHKKFQYGYTSVSIGREGIGYGYTNRMSGLERMYFGINFMDASNMYRLHGLRNVKAISWKPIENNDYGFGVFETLRTNRIDSGSYSFDDSPAYVILFRNFGDRQKITEVDITDARGWRSHTLRFPQNTSDYIRKGKDNFYDWTDRPKKYPTLSTSILRYHQFLGGNLTINQVWIDNPSDGKRLKLKFTVTGSNYRGARQHWGVVGKTLGYDMGDHYE